MANWQSVRIANQTEIPLVYVISQVGPLYWGVIQPDERVTRVTGRVWFTITCYPYDGKNEPTTMEAVLGVLIPTATALFIAITAGIAAAGAIAALPAAGTAAASLQPLVAGPAFFGIEAGLGAGSTATAAAITAKNALIKSIELAYNKVEKTRHYANGDWIHVRGGIKKNEPHSAWQPMRFEG
ncbi:unnamed protein product [Calypogeia fissa]